MTAVEIIKKRMITLKTKTFEELSNLKDCQNEEVIVNGKKNSMAIWKDKVDSEKIQIVIQIYNYYFLGFGKMTAEGFTIDSKGKINDLKREELYEFT